MIDQSKQIQAYILSNLAANPSGIVKLAADKFSTTNTTVHRHINTLIKRGQVVKNGNTRSAKYYLTNAYDRLKNYQISNGVFEDKVFQEFNDIFMRFPKNIYDICYFGVTEMLNNAIEHSRGSRVSLETKFSAPLLTITVKDNGVGAFKTICDYLHIDDMREGILHISKGKITSDPSNHTGQGIFFTSRMFDLFTIDANSYVYTKDNQLRDWTFLQRHGTTGTEIVMIININSQISCRQVFAEYEGEDFAFDKTEILVHLSDFKEDHFVSRSQARRILLGLEKFSLITFDFKKIEFVGQGFVDEIFRVFKNKHNDINIQYINANDSVRFMIERGKKYDAR